MDTAEKILNKIYLLPEDRALCVQNKLQLQPGLVYVDKINMKPSPESTTEKEHYIYKILGKDQTILQTRLTDVLNQCGNKISGEITRKNGFNNIIYFDKECVGTDCSKSPSNTPVKPTPEKGDNIYLAVPNNIYLAIPNNIYLAYPN